MTQQSREISAFRTSVQRVIGGESVFNEAEKLYDQLSPAERLGLLDGDMGFWQGMQDLQVNGYNYVPYSHARVERIGLPGLQFTDGPRGVVIGKSTVFPVSMARGATWDASLEREVGRAIGIESRAQGANFFAGICVNLPRHPAWGRSQETYGEDPVLLGEMGAALSCGARENVMTCVKHFAVNSMENARFSVNVDVQDSVLHEVYLPHFKRVIDSNVDAVMSAYNSLNGEWCGQNADLLNGILREKWNFEGVVVSDFIFGLRDPGKSIQAGLDIEMPFQQQRKVYFDDLQHSAVPIDWTQIRETALRIISVQLRHYVRMDGTPEPSSSEVFSSKHRELSKRVASSSTVVLKNNLVGGRPLLPLDLGAINSVALIGRLASLENTGDHGSSDVRSPQVVSALEGISTKFAGAAVRSCLDDDLIAAAGLAAETDVAVVVVGFTAEDEGEFLDPSISSRSDLQALFPPAPQGVDPAASAAPPGPINAEFGHGGDRKRLSLRPFDEELIKAVAASNPRTIVVVVAGGTVMCEAWIDSPAAVLMAWYSGAEGGTALAEMLVGEAEPAGRLPFAIPTSESHLPFFDSEATNIVYDEWHGQRKLDRDNNSPRFPLGYGLGYSVVENVGFDLVSRNGDSCVVRATVKNVGDRATKHSLQVYGKPAEVDGAVRKLMAFSSLNLSAQELASIEIVVPLTPLTKWESALNRFGSAPKVATLELSKFSGDESRISILV